ncbi:hypothetical protein PGTUg99_050107 [Puccinia graminis f. sp. tritici]|uniref:Retrovirus-related Pol polyprotein from transposon TNT 1-94-like beta-barrel domain-containing protein n=1 Tax=Puccinia graminis f. sp. tritici TaxID=56615 RepID=A0A5B0PDA7_PUCGR|nr:hypothetical protein PGTUg99_050107 [Puccinia graminis f. sp. tritici]
MNDKSSNPSIPTLSNVNWDMWSMLVEGYMKQHDLYSFISETEADPTDAAELKSFKSKKLKASGVLQQYMGITNYQKFRTKDTKDDPRAMWLKLEGHYQSNAISNQAKVYNDFIALKFKGNDIESFIVDITTHISRLNAVGLRIGIPKDFELHENLFCENILEKIPSGLVHTREVLIQNRPLTVDRLQQLLENRRLDDSTVKIKSEETALKTVSRSSKEPECTDGAHNPEANHPEHRCFELYPEQRARMEKRRAKSLAKSQAKAKTAQVADDDSSVSSVAWHTIAKAFSVKLSPNTAYLDSGASHHMIADRSSFATYSTDSKCKIELADGKTTICPGIGNVYVKTESGQPLKLECLHVPQLVGNLISEGRLFRRGCDRVRTGPLTANLVNEGETLFKVELNDQDIFTMKLEIIKGGRGTPATIP